MSSPARPRYTAAEYLALERGAPTRNEYLDGEIFAMARASRRHNLICLNVGAELRAQLRERPCEVYTSEMRVMIAATDLYTYPDGVVVWRPAGLRGRRGRHVAPSQGRDGTDPTAPSTC